MSTESVMSHFYSDI